ncbi:hypothetical protein Tco_0328644 [Tanacetum coccineum]
MRRCLIKRNEKKIDESVHEEVPEEVGAKKKDVRHKEELKVKKEKACSSSHKRKSLDHQYHYEWQSFFLTTKPQYDQTKPNEDIYLNKVTRSNGHQRFFRTLMGVLSILDREDLKVILMKLVMEDFKENLLKVFDKMLWGDLMIMFNQGDTADFWDTQQNWKLIKNRYPLAKEVLSNMLELKLETEEESSMALELIKFVKQQLEEFEDSNDDDSVTSDHEEAERPHALLRKDSPDVVWEHQILLWSFASPSLLERIEQENEPKSRGLMSNYDFAPKPEWVTSKRCVGVSLKGTVRIEFSTWVVVHEWIRKQINSKDKE